MRRRALHDAPRNSITSRRRRRAAAETRKAARPPRSNRQVSAERSNEKASPAYVTLRQRRYHDGCVGRDEGHAAPARSMNGQ